MAITQTGQLSGAAWAYLSFTATETSVDNVNNISYVEVTCQLTSTDSRAYWGTQIDLYLYIDNQEKIAGVNNFTPGWIYGAGVLWTQNLGTYPVQHNGDGTKTVPIRLYTDWGGWGNVDLNGNLTLTTIPREARFTTQNGDFTIGNSKTLNWTNDGNKWVRLYVEAGGSNLGTYNLGQVTQKTWTPTSSEISTLYTRMGATARTTGVAWIINTYNDSNYSSYLGQSVLYGTITAPVNYSGAVPTFASSNIGMAVTGNSVVKDPDGTTLQTNSWSSLLGNSCVLAGFSSVKGSVTTAATPKYSATMSYYTGTIDGNTSTINAVGDFPVFTNATDKTITVKAYDTRGDFKTETKSLTYINNSYVTPVITNCTLNRINQVGTTATLNLAGTYYGTGYLSGQNNIGTANALNVKYRYKATDSNTWGNWIDITGDCTISGTNFNYSGNLSTLFTADTSYNVQVMAYDYVATAYSSIILNNGNPSLHIVKNGLAVYGKYDTLAGGHLQVEGMEIVNYIFRNGCHVKRETSMNVGENFTQITFPTVNYDPNSMFNTSTNKITIQKAGTYLVYANCKFNDDTAIVGRMLSLYVNGVATDEARGGADGSGRCALSFIVNYNLAANDELSLYCYLQGTNVQPKVNRASLGIIYLGN